MKLGEVKKRVVIRNTIICLTLIALGWYLNVRLSPNMAMQAGMRPDPYVLVTNVEIQDISPAKTYIGHVEPLESVDLMPEVSGIVTKVLFNEGSFVNKGDTLFIIEQDKYQATLNLRTAELERAKAVLKQAKKDYDRQKSLNKQKFASESALDTAESSFLQAQANVALAQANMDIAQIDMQYTEIKSPINGYIGKALVTEGNLITAHSQTLARIVQLNPIRVSFSMSDKDLLGYKKTNTLAKDNAAFKTELILPDGTRIINNFISRFTDNEVNQKTASIAVFAEFKNDSYLLIPGSYVRVVVKEKQEKQAILVPQGAISQDEHGSYVFVVNDNDIAEQARLKLGDIIGDKQVVIEGLKLNDKVIIQGIQKVANGQKVKASFVGKSEGDI